MPDLPLSSSLLLLRLLPSTTTVTGTISLLGAQQRAHASFPGSRTPKRYERESVVDLCQASDKTIESKAFSRSVKHTRHGRLGDDEAAFELLKEIQQQGVQPNTATIIRILQACSSSAALELGKQVHALIVDRAMESDVFVATALVGMYGRCGTIDDARRVFDKMLHRDSASWNTMIAANARGGYEDEAFKLFHKMQQEGFQLSKTTFLSLLNTCTRPEALALGKQVHALLVDNGIEQDIIIGNALITMYDKCGSIEDAQKVFSKIFSRNVVTWTAIITACARHGFGEEALKNFHKMGHEGVKPNNITFISILNACSSPQALALGKQIHALIIDSNIQIDVIIGTALVRMYGKCGSIDDARRVFDELSQRDHVSWTTMIAVYAWQGCGEEAFKLFQGMQQEGVKPNKTTFISILNACSSGGALTLGRQVHSLIINRQIESDMAVGTALVDMYGKCGSIDDATRVFNKMSKRAVASWNAMIAAFACHGYCKEALKLFHRMQEEGVKPDKVTFISFLKLCSSPEALALGKQVHALIVSCGMESNVVVGTALVSMYGNCGRIKDAWMVFNSMRQRDVASWNAMIAAYARQGFGEAAFKLFQRMQQEGPKPDKITFISILNACSSLAVLTLGKQVHSLIVKNGIESDVVVGNALVSMYGNCGSIEDARNVFNRMFQRNVVSWSAMIAACAQHGCGKEALQLFQQMQREGQKPNEVTLTSLLFACSHAKLVDEGLHYFNSMSQEYGISPTIEHYNCIVDLLGRSGCLGEAEDVINKMPCQSNTVTWMTLLAACRIYGCFEQGKRAAERALQSDPQFAPAYVALSNIYALAGRWDDVDEVRKLMMRRGIKKEPGRSWIDVNNKVHEFIVRDRSHPQTQEIYVELKKLIEQIKKVGYMPDTNLVLHNMEEEQKAELLCCHSEKLAIAFGHISVPSGMPLRIFKNLRVCSDCHTATKFISKVVRREIMLRDNNRFHHIKDGVCSCGDYW